MKRNYLPNEYKVKDWSSLHPYFDELLNRNVDDKEELRTWFKDRSELESVLSEDGAWRYIKMTCDTTDEKLRDSFNFFVQEIQPKIDPYSDKLNKKVAESKVLPEVESEKGFNIMIRELRKDIEIFRDENIPLYTEMQTKSQEYGQISGAMTIDLNGKELTLQQAAVELQKTDREWRQKVYNKISTRRLLDRDKLDNLFTQLVQIRSKIARNAGFDNYRDYMFKSLGRFDYTPQDCFDFHEAVASEVVPLLDQLALHRQKKLGLDKLKPWDKAVDTEGRPPLKAFEGGEDLLNKGIEVFSRVDTYHEGNGAT